MCQSVMQWIVFYEMFRIFTQTNRNLPYRLHSKFTRLRAVTDFEQKNVTATEKSAEIRQKSTELCHINQKN